MSATKRYIEELAEKLGIEFDEVTEQHMVDDMDRLYEKHAETRDMVNLCKCNMCGAILVDTNPQVDAKLYPYEGQLSTEHMVDEEGGLIGCPVCKTDAYLQDL
jgi:hypothetical protein